MLLLYVTDSEDPPSVNPSSVDENMEYSDTEKDSDSKSTTAKATSSVSGVDEYEFKDDDEEEDLSKALNDRHILRREVRPKEKEEKEENHYTPKQSKSDQTMSSCKLKKPKSSRVRYCSSDSSDEEMEAPSERKCSPTRSLCNDTHKAESRTKRESLTLTPVEKGKANKKKNKSQSKNKENQEVQEDGKENSKSLLFSTATVSDNSDKSVREEDSFKMSFSPKDDSSVHLFHLSSVKSPKLNYSQTDKQMTPLKQENTKTFISIGDGSCPMDGVKYNHYTDSDYTEGSSSKSCKHKDKSKHHYKEHGLEGDDRSSSPFKDASLSNSMDGSEGAFRKADKEGKVIKKHKLKHKEKDKYRKDYESERNRHRQKELRKDGHRNMEFDREFWKENFFKSDENEELKGKCETPDSCSPQKSLDSSPIKDEKKDKHLLCSSTKERKQKDDREKDKLIKKEKKEVAYKDERGGKDGKGTENDDRSESLNLLRKSEETLPSPCVKEEIEDKPLTGNLTDHNQLETTEKSSREKNDKRLTTKDRELEKCEKKQAEKEKKTKFEHLLDKSDLHNPTDRWKERDRLTAVSHSSGEKSHKENEKLKLVPVTKKHEENKKNKDKLDRRSEKERQEKEHSSSDHRDKDKISAEKKGKAPEKISDHSKIDRIKEKDREKDKDSDKKKKEKSKETTLSSSSSNLKYLLEEKRGYTSESNKTVTSKLKEEVMKTPEKDRDRRERDRDLERHRDPDRERHKEKDKDKERSQQNRDSKLSKARPLESESDRSKSKVSPVQKETRPKEKRLVNDDLMQTSFERMLSLKDQEIELWRKKYLEKIKQKERERLKQRPGADSGKQKNKDKAKVSSSSEPCANKELLRSKSSEIPEASTREKILKDATSGRTLSLDAKSLSCFGKTGPVIENSLSRSPRPDSERSGIMSRSVSMISVASSEDSCQATMLTPRPTEYDSDLNLEASDSQPPFLQSSLTVQSSRSPIVSDKDSNSLPDMAPGSRTPRLASPYLRAVLDEDAKAGPSEQDRLLEESQRNVDVANTSEEPGKIHLTETSPAVTQEGLSIHHLLSAHLPCVIPEIEHSAGVEDTSGSSSSQFACVSNSRDTSVKDLAGQQTSLSQASSLLLTAVEVSKLNTDNLPEQSGQDQLDSSDTDMTNDSNKNSSVAPASQLGPAASAQTEQSFTTKTLSINLKWDTVSEPTIDQSARTDVDLRLDQRARSLSVGLENTTEDGCMENVSSGSKMDLTTSQGPSISSCRISSDESNKTLSCTASLGRDSQQVTEKIFQDDCKSGVCNENTSTANAQLEKNEYTLAVPSILNIPQCAGPEQTSDEPMEVSGEETDNDQVIAETQVEKAIAIEDVAQTQPLPDAKTDVDVEMPDQLAVEEKLAKPGTPSDGDQNLACAGIDSQAELTSGATSGSSSPLSVTDRDSDPSGARTKVKSLDDEVDVQVTHPRKRKMPRVPPSSYASLSAQQIKEKTQQSLAAIVDSLKLEEIQPYQTERANPYYEFLHIRRKIEEKRKVLCSVIPQAPQYYDEYVTFNGSYLLDGNPLSKLCIPTVRHYFSIFVYGVFFNASQTNELIN